MKIIVPFLILLFISCSHGNPSVKEGTPAELPATEDENISSGESSDEKIISFHVDPSKDSVCLLWKDEKGEKLKSLDRLSDYLKEKNLNLVFAMNAGMYTEDLSPLGLYIENGKTLRKINSRTRGYGNFYIQPGGIFFITAKGSAGIRTVKSFTSQGIRFATQSGPMLVVNKTINKEFNPESENRNIRNGVGILPDGKVIMAISSQPVTFHEFASFFKEAGCSNALYLDGGISGALYPAKKIRPVFSPGYGVMMAVIRKRTP